ncbi:imidazolonepropionase [bacterium]|nr:imidazolonepropionase [candidate division CSSED10-310 bacterium]
MTHHVDFLLHNSAQIITLAGAQSPRKGRSMSELSIRKNAAIAAKDGVIVWVGSENEITEELDILPEATIIDAENNAVLPGLVDCHTHLVFAGTREDEFAQKIAGVPYMEIAAKGGGIKRTVRSTRQASLEELVNLGRKRLKTFLEFGVTCVEIKSGYGLDLPTEKKILQAAKLLAEEFPMELPRTFLGAHEIPSEIGKKEYIASLLEDMIPDVSRNRLAEFCDVFCEKGVYDIDDARRVLSAGKSAGLQPKIHAEQLTNSGAARLAAECHAISADHLDHIDETSMKALARSGTIGVILPGAVFFLGLKQYPPVRKMIEHGMAVALSTDFNPGSCMTQNLALMMTIACTQCRMTIDEAITAITINAAWAAGRGSVCGSIEPGKRADIIVLDTPSYEMLPYHFGHNHIRHVFCKGKTAVENFQYLW